MNQRLQTSIVREGASLVDAMRSLEESVCQIVLVVDTDHHLIGVLTDGDIRRALLSGAGLESSIDPFVVHDCLTVGERENRADVLELMQAREIAQIPVIDEERRVVGLHLLHEMLAVAERPNWAVVMAGGRGVRLAPITDSIPKSMLSVAGRPILERIVLHLVSAGLRRIFLSVNYLGHVIERHFGDGERFGCSIEYLREEQPLGTAGSLSLLPQGEGRPSSPLLVMNGDLVTRADVGSILDYHGQGDQALTVGVREYLHQIPFGAIESDGDILVSLAEKPTLSRLVSAGIYVVEPDCLGSISSTEPTSMPDLVRDLQLAGGTVRVFPIDDEWIDVGRYEELLRARQGA